MYFERKAKSKVCPSVKPRFEVAVAKQDTSLIEFGKMLTITA